MKLIINGEEREVQDGLSVSGLLDCLGVEPARVAVEVNFGIVKKCNYDAHLLNDGDRVEIVSFVGGG